MTTKLVELLQSNNLSAPANSVSDCAYLEDAIGAWVKATAYVQRSAPSGSDFTDLSLLWVKLLPVRCPFQQGTEGVITSSFCRDNLNAGTKEVCSVWGGANATSNEEYFARRLNLRVGEIVMRSASNQANGIEYYVSAMFNERHTVASA